MQVGAVGFSPYVYNTNSLSKSSMNKISSIPDDVNESKTDYSSLTGETTNPLKKGETSNFMDVLDMQMQMSKMHQSQLFAE